MSRAQTLPRLLLLPLLWALLACEPSAPPNTSAQPDQPGTAFAGALAMPDAFSADAAQDVLNAGGNAVDAAIAAAFVLAVTQPEAGNIGGGGFLLAHMDGESVFLDYRETAPAAAHRDVYLDADGNVIDDASVVGRRAAGVPGTVAGMWAAHQRWGTRPWRELLAPAINLARDGFQVPPLLAANVAAEAPGFADRTNFNEYFAAIAAGERWQQPELAATLERIRDAGPEDFYQGETARLLAEDMSAHGGWITAEDLAGYEVAWRKPLTAPWRGFEVVSAPPPSSGGFGVIQLLKMKAWLDDEFADTDINSARYVHLIAEMQKRVFADRAEYLGDADFVDVPIAALTDEDYIQRRAAEVNLNAISSSSVVEPGLPEGRHTTHFSIVDKNGNAVSNTYTLNTSFGSGVVVPGAGFLLNNEMDDFSAKPGVPNVYGVIGREANAIEAGKRPLSSMSPTLLLEDGRVRMAVGTPGGSTIFGSVFLTIAAIVDGGLTAADAVALPRFHHQLLPPDLVTFTPSRPLPPQTTTDLEQMGYRVEPHGWEFGDVQVVWFDGTRWQAAADPRHRGTARVLGDAAREP
ncbi:MAG: gamma-glutamyltransferase [Gammaproteobacteria bacterium]|nr:gamma-glutamyltransferase [Gammaproteobacteria bacterium]